jgi:gas vesicle protein GvpL/GvpF
LRVWGETSAPWPPAAEGGSGPGARYLASRRHAHERARRVPELDTLRPALAELVREERAERHDRPPLLATVQHLIARGASVRYLSVIEAAGPRLLPWRVSVSGPWLPYAFGEAAA